MPRVAAGGQATIPPYSLPPALQRSVTPRGRGVTATQLCPAAPCDSRERRSLVIPRELRSLVARRTGGPAHSRKAQSAFRTIWTRPGFLLPFHGGGGASEGYCDPRLPDLYRGFSCRFTYRWTARASPTTGCEGDALAPQEPVYSLLLPTPACARTVVPQSMSWGVLIVCERACSPPSRSRCSRSRTEAPRYRLLIATNVRHFGIDRTTTCGRTGTQVQQSLTRTYDRQHQL